MEPKQAAGLYLLVGFAVSAAWLATVGDFERGVAWREWRPNFNVLALVCGIWFAAAALWPVWTAYVAARWCLERLGVFEK